MANPNEKKHKLLKWVLVALAAVLIALVVVFASNWTYIKAMPTVSSSDVLDEWLEDGPDSAAASSEAASEAASSGAASSEAAGAESEAAASSSSQPEEEPASSPEATETPAHTASPSPSPAASSSASSSTAATPSPSPSATSTPSPSPSATPTPAPTPSPSAAPTWEQQADAQIAALKQMEKTYESRLYGIMWDAFDEYQALPESSRNLVNKVSIVLSKRGDMTAMEKECDKEVEVILTELRRILTENGQSTAVADQAEKAYKDKKSALMAELMQQAYSGGDGSGQSGNWLNDHAPRS